MFDGFVLVTRQAVLCSHGRHEGGGARPQQRPGSLIALFSSYHFFVVMDQSFFQLYFSSLLYFEYDQTFFL